MAVVNVKSAGLTLMDTASSQAPKKGQVRGEMMCARGKVEVTNGDSIASIFRVCRVPSNAFVAQLLLRCTAITGAIGDIGLYRTPADGGAVVSVALFASAQSLASALAAWTDVTNESTTLTPTLIEQPLWQILGLSADPGVWYDIAITLTAAATASGQATLMCEYTE